MTIPITKPVFGPEESKAVQTVLDSGWIVQGPYVKKFEEKFAAYTQAPFAAATSSCTTALHMAVAALGLKTGEEVIVPAFTWVATPNVVEYMGARPVFCDIHLDTFNLDVAKIESLITPRTVGILPVHLFGLCADMPAIQNIAKKHHLWVVEDAACAFGAQIRGVHAGLFGDIGCFSFHPRKSITTGEGGMVTTRRTELDQLIRSLRDHGASRSDLSRHQGKTSFLLAAYDHLGYNYRMTDIQGAIGCVQMDRAPKLLEQRTQRARDYDRQLASLPWLQLPKVPEGYVHGYQSYVGFFQPEAPTLKNVERLHGKRNDVMMRLEEQGVMTRQGTHAPVLLGYYAKKYKLHAEDYPNATLADRLSLALPLFSQMTDAEMELVCTQLKGAFRA
jgi:dTDP-4-amino-4,6-dideoxygalactose transaminase